MSDGVEYAQTIAFHEQHQAEILHGGEIQSFVSDAGGLAAIADIGHDRDVASLEARAQRHAGEHGDQVTEN